MIDRVDHFVLTVADLGATLEFYERVLGFTPRLQKGRPAA
jgi:catechol 2,3-dioxygenase-like lactoylglutathione lyase family enzyme